MPAGGDRQQSLLPLEQGLSGGGKKRLQGDTVREASSGEVVDLRQENEQLKQLVAELSLKNRLLKKSLTGLE
jgi:hypothetical protein